MQQTSQQRRFTHLASAVGLMLVAGLFAAAPASAAVPSPPTVHIEDGGDGFLNAEEVGNVVVTGTYDTSAGVTSVTGRLVADPECALDADFRTDAQTATLNLDGTYELGPFDITGFPEGTVVCAQARAHNPSGTSDRGFSDNLPVIDTTPPAAMIDVLDDDGLVDADLAEAGVELMYFVDEDGPNATVSVENAGEAAPAACTYADLPRGPETLVVEAACFAELTDGAIEFVVAGADEAGNIGTAVQASALDRLLAIVVAGGGPFANAVQTQDGTALPVLFQFESLGDTEASAVVTVTDRNGDSVTSEAQEMAGTSSEEVRTVLVDVSALADGEITVDGVLTTETSTHTASATTVLDLVGPATAWSTSDGATFFRIQIPFILAFGDASLDGSSVDPGLVSPIQFVYLTGRNLDNNERFGRTARMRNQPAEATDWSLTRELSPGEWQLQAYAQDEAGNIGPTETITVTVLGLI